MSADHEMLCEVSKMAIRLQRNHYQKLGTAILHPLPFLDSSTNGLPGLPMGAT